MKDFCKKIIFYDFLPTVLQEQILLIRKKFKSLKKKKKYSRFSIANVPLSKIQIAVYFDGNEGQLYQIKQWLKQLELLNKEEKILIVVRKLIVYNWIRVNTDFIVVHCQTMNDLMTFYNKNNIKCILYVNHSINNFQSLINGKALHVHINHGESDKTSTISNQSKAYDYILISGQAAYDKYNLNLIKKDMNKFIKIGRPQVDNKEVISGFDTSKKVVLYAPTWEGTHESMNFSSLVDYSLEIVDLLLQSGEYYIVYKPHPNTGSRDKELLNINNKIKYKIMDSGNGVVVLDGDINSLYSHVDIAIFDNSAVAIDYLIVDKPMIMTDLFNKIEGRLDKPTITGAARILSRSEVENIIDILNIELKNDTMQNNRRKISKYFLGDYNYSIAESTNMFIKTVFDIVGERDQLVEVINDLNKSELK